MFIPPPGLTTPTVGPCCATHLLSCLEKACLEVVPYILSGSIRNTLNYYRDCPTNGIVGFYSAILRSKDADRITNRVDTDQTAP